LRARLGQEALALAASFGWDTIATRTAGFYTEVVAAFRYASLK
jgi:hypothetical protein